MRSRLFPNRHRNCNAFQIALMCAFCLLGSWVGARALLAEDKQEDAILIGTTFSPRQCFYLDLDWRETYLQSLDYGFEIIRLGAYWDTIELTNGTDASYLQVI